MSRAEDFAKGGICIECEARKQTTMKLAMVFLILIFLIVLGTVFFHTIENFGWYNSFYFTVATLTTVGYGDFTPVTNVGKIFASFYMLVNIPIMLYAFSVIAELYFEQRFSGIAKILTRNHNKKPNHDQKQP